MNVKCIDQSYCATDLTEGNVYEVISEEGEEKEYFKLVDDNGRTGVYYKERFVEVVKWDGWDYGGGVDDPRY